jgi:hypothetical protein
VHFVALNVVNLIQLRSNGNVPVYNLKAYGGVEVWFHSFFNSALSGWMDSRAGMHTLEKR